MVVVCDFDMTVTAANAFLCHLLLRNKGKSSLEREAFKNDLIVGQRWVVGNKSCFQ